MSNEEVSPARIKELVAMLNIPDTVKHYPWFQLTGTGNIMLDIGSATRAWRKKDAGVSERIFQVINDAGCDSDEVDALLEAICSPDSPDMD
jgi:hypothetical protein